MIGSGNPQEGELRPQLLDRFGLAVSVATMMDGQSRTQMVMDRIAFEKSPEEFCAGYEKEQEELRGKLEAARQRLKDGVEVNEDTLLKVAELCSLLGVEGLRGDIVINRSAKALVAFQGRSKVELEDVERVLGLCLNHRLRKDVLDQIDSGTKVALAWLKVQPLKRSEKLRRRNQKMLSSKNQTKVAVSEQDQNQELGEGYHLELNQIKLIFLSRFCIFG
eukprot:TRINITY_DN4889_c0_g1_i1.p2 TRINITY_DN4889_c0_g1~~TRINITY_DN4889_c0_g1_i1.p2  ORF type:complete len:220 (-),score=33.84 TRINITY_DN4889_c0_g1_i1:102-761(-)